MPLSQALYHTCFICGQRCKCWSCQPKLTSSVISDVKTIIYIFFTLASEKYRASHITEYEWNLSNSHHQRSLLYGHIYIYYIYMNESHVLDHVGITVFNAYCARQVAAEPHWVVPPQFIPLYCMLRIIVWLWRNSKNTLQEDCCFKSVHVL